MPEYFLLYALGFSLVAYYLKGFSGFGPALIFIPTMTLITDPETAIVSATFFDMMAGLILLISVFKQIDWRLVLPVSLLIFAGAIPGAMLLKQTSAEMIKILIGAGILTFIVILAFSKDSENKSKPKNRRWLKYTIALFSGFMGGLIGITGPALIIYLKLRHTKDYFRTQLIAIFFFGALWRYILYIMNGINLNISALNLFWMGIAMIVGLYLGYKTHIAVNEKRFNQVVAMALIIPAINLLYSGFKGL